MGWDPTDDGLPLAIVEASTSVLPLPIFHPFLSFFRLELRFSSFEETTDT